jgi:N5-(carboxyethyl)ornithine synthase
MRRIGFVISHKENEKRRALLPVDIRRIRNRKQLYFEEGYGAVLGISDDEYLREGAKVVPKEEAYHQQIICNPKAPIPEEQGFFNTRQILFGWIHAVQGRSITDFLLDRRMTGIAWENMFEKGLHSFWRNNEIAGEAGILHSLSFLGIDPSKCKCAIIGNGNCARGAFRMLSRLGAKVVVYDRKTVQRLRNELGQYDMVVNAVLWDVFRKDHLIYKEDLPKMRRGSMIVDISCDPEMGVETSRPTTITGPVYEIEGILHYCVDHIPAIFYRSATESISTVVCKYVDDLIEGNRNEILEKATVIENGIILNDKISCFQNR